MKPCALIFPFPIKLHFSDDDEEEFKFDSSFLIFRFCFYSSFIFLFCSYRFDLRRLGEIRKEKGQQGRDRVSPASILALPLPTGASSFSMEFTLARFMTLESV
ncbi:hypothetical protein L1987_27787 [Smallanthus sonchifolius]|uniref:Uncharacterized protein n=1 Tax=Smallanthus sonchifolius TaxID=185202 RepID=A0ACB9IEB2_9ASTR|nr:hypothetical protein L1987_27787 [Smallanthus sonchifolius]